MDLGVIPINVLYCVGGCVVLALSALGGMWLAYRAHEKQRKQVETHEVSVHESGE